ncbi:hypothetical protein A374_09458 [Fictibacillus macauensis ZFHKF-1]|uniref:Uncharacterized protein n=1 Tax=Fictibacillus macauensis ZFHKF-1 TaxID=1196324 RepID=I8UF86_9BACL|nr:hypothetical protein [Fictibacillus macauensis]EIT85453.1 hypothetical protein A374_09458 [Fictibacillus macauensis ZFHKF-1]
MKSFETLRLLLTVALLVYGVPRLPWNIYEVGSLLFSVLWTLFLAITLVAQLQKNWLELKEIQNKEKCDLFSNEKERKPFLLKNY